MRPERTLRGITELIVRCCDPERILLFGSYAKGQNNADSDLDLLVVGHFRESPRLRGHEAKQLMRKYPIGIDLHFMTPEEVASEMRNPYGFVSSVLSAGHVLYQKKNI